MNLRVPPLLLKLNFPHDAPGPRFPVNISDLVSTRLFANSLLHRWRKVFETMIGHEITQPL